MKIATVNLGSSSVRLGVFTISAGKPRRGASRRLEIGVRQPEDVCAEFLAEHGSGVACVAHRVVHGGRNLIKTVVIDAEVEQAIMQMASLAPLHNPAALACVRACRELLGVHVPQVAVFDTAFFAALPAVASTYALPPDLCAKHGIRRYGFHGLAHRAMWRRWADLRPDLAGGGRLVTFQLGSGCSIAAIAEGRPMDTSMGFSPLEGLVMATRGGDLDPGIVPFLLQVAGLSITEMEAILNGGAGLRSMARTSDLRALAGSQDPAEQLAFDLYGYRARKYLGAYAAVLGGIDGVVFGGGVGEHVPEVRSEILVGMGWCGIELDAVANAAAIGHESRISTPASPVAAWVVPVDEAMVLAEEALDLLGTNGEAT